MNREEIISCCRVVAHADCALVTKRAHDDDPERILKDFRSPHRLYPGVQDGFNRKGLISDTGERKQAFYVLQEFYRQRSGEKAPAKP